MYGSQDRQTASLALLGTLSRVVDTGLPTLVARRMMKESDGVIARLVNTTQDARTAASEGANIIVLQVFEHSPENPTFAICRSSKSPSS